MLFYTRVRNALVISFFSEVSISFMKGTFKAIGKKLLNPINIPFFLKIEKFR